MTFKFFAAAGGHILSAAEAAQGSANIWNTVLQYIVYGIVIIACVIALIVLSRYSRLPRHGELRKKVTALKEEIEGISTGENRVDFFKSVAKAMYRADKLAYLSSLMAEKERYADLNKISSALTRARGELSHYKYGRKAPDEKEGMEEAVKHIDQAISLIDGMLERDKKIGKTK